MIHVIVLDDEREEGEWLSLKLTEFQNIRVIRTLQHPLKLLEYCKNVRIDVVFLDIVMPEMSGFELAKRLSALEHTPEIVFVTAYEQYALEAFRVNALDYIVKPVQDKELHRVLEKITKRIDKFHQFQKKQQKAKEREIISIADISLDFSTAKGEELFFYMLLKGRHLVSKWEMIEDIWPEKEPDKGESNVRTTVFRVNQTMDNSGLDLRIKGSKGYYYFIHSSNKLEPVKVQLYPSIEALYQETLSVVEVLQKYNILKKMEERDYLWTVTSKQIENDYYKWAMKVILYYPQQKSENLQALNYLLEQFPWQEQLIIQIMALLLSTEGKGALVHFYQQQQQKWKLLYEIPLSDKIELEYQKLIGR